MDKAQLSTHIPLEQGTEWDTFCSDIWGYLDPTDAESFKSRQEEFHVQTDDCLRKLNFDRLAVMTSAYNWVSPHVQLGDSALFFEVGALVQALGTAHSCANLRLFDQAYKLVAVAMELMDEGFHSRPNSELRLDAIAVIADCKWQQPDSFRDKLWSPELMLEEYNKHYGRITSILKDDPSLDKTGSAVMSLEQTGFLLLKVAARYLPDELPYLIEEFNSRWNAKVEKEEGHFLTNDPPLQKSQYYWDFEIVKRFISEKLTLEELDFCHHHLVQAVKNEYRDPDANLLLALDLQYRYLAKTFTNILEFPVG